MMRNLGLIPIVLALALSGCTQSYVVLLDNPDGPTGSVEFTTDVGSQAINEANNGVKVTSRSSVPGKPQPSNFEAIAKVFHQVFEFRPARPDTFTLYFKFASIDLVDGSGQTLVAIADSIKNHPGADADIFGHTDASDTSERNEVLARKRADVVRKYLVAAGVDPSRIAEDALGERQLKVVTKDGVREPLNRRVEIAIR